MAGRSYALSRGAALSIGLPSLTDKIIIAQSVVVVKLSVCYREGPLCRFRGGTVFHEPFQGVVRAYDAHVGFRSCGGLALPTLL